MEKPKPCPFCGSTNIKIDKCTARVRCGDCYATSGLITKLAPDHIEKEDAALMAWNRRYDAEDNGRREERNH